MKNKGIFKNIVKTNLINTNFIRVVNKNSLNEVINTNIYKEIKLTDNSVSYTQVLPNELPLEIINLLSIGNNYKKMSEEETSLFLKNSFISEEEILRKNEVAQFEFLKIGECCDITYFLSKDEEEYYTIQGIYLSEYGRIKSLRQIYPNELPYVIMDIIDKYDLHEFTALIAENVFFRLINKNGKYLIVIYSVKSEEKNGAEVLKIDVLNFYTMLIKDNDFILVNDVNHDLFFKKDEINMQEITDDFVKSIGLNN